MDSKNGCMNKISDGNFFVRVTFSNWDYFEKASSPSKTSHKFKHTKKYSSFHDPFKQELQAPIYT